MIDLVLKAMNFAISAHQTQVRKYGGEEYIRHPQKVAGLVSLYHGVTDEEVAAAWLHDVVEDCEVTIGEIQTLFGKQVAAYVWDLTNEYTKESYPSLKRKERKKLEFERISKLNDRSLRLKLVDRLANISDCLLIDETPDDFKELLYNETKQLLELVESRCIDNDVLEEIYIGVCSAHSRLGLDVQQVA